MQIILFDIDGTLVNTGGAGGAALRHAFSAEFGIPEVGRVSLSGRTDRAIGRSLFEMHGVDDSPEHWQRLRRAYLDRLPGYLPNYPGRVLPGVKPLLATLAARDSVAVGLLTGNLREGARIKLEYYELFQHFAFGGFGDEHHDRNCVADEALRAARQCLNGRQRVEQIWVIGDTPFDVSCGRSIQAQVLAVATGIHSRGALEASQPDLLLDDLSATDQVLELLGLAKAV